MQMTFPAPEPPELELRVPDGRVTLDADERTDVEVRVEPLNEAASELLDEFRIEQRGRRIVVHAPDRRGFSLFGRSPEWDVRVVCPVHTAVDGDGRSADLRARGALARVGWRSVSGDAELETVLGDARITSTSGDIRIGVVTGDAELQTTSGDASVDSAAGRLRATLVSGDLRVGEVAETIETRSVSGDQLLARVSAGTVTVNTVSGDVEIGVAAGTDVWMDVRSLSGDTTSLLTPTEAPEGGAGVELRVASISGDVTIRGA